MIQIKLVCDRKKCPEVFEFNISDESMFVKHIQKSGFCRKEISGQQLWLCPKCVAEYGKIPDKIETEKKRIYGDFIANSQDR